MNSTYISSLLIPLLLSAAGCGPGNTASNPASKNAAAAPPVQTTRVSFSDLAVSPKPEVTPQLIEHGKAVYAQNCAACHGIKGDGNGDAAAFLAPKPRNFVEAKYRLRSTPTGQLPTDVDLFRSVSMGMGGTPMPAWKHILNDDERWAVVEYIKTFSPRFTANEDRKAIASLGTPPARNETALAEGKALYTKLACVTCHGETGHGDGPSAVSLVDDSQSKIKPRDFAKP